MVLPALVASLAFSQGPDPAHVAGPLAREVADKGWIVYSARTDRGDWDLFLMRPDGSIRRQVTQTAEYNEAAAKFSPDGTRILYYRMPKAEPLDNNRYGLYDLVIANADASNPMVLGNDYPWACWGADGRHIACLARNGVQIVDLQTKRPVRTLKRKGMVQQLSWSPDGKWFCATANGLGEQWAIGRMDAVTGELNRVSDNDCFNCTPDWFPDSQHVIYSKGIPKTEGWAQLWMADGDGKNRRMLYGETGRHIYGGAVSPDGKHLLFTRSREDLGKVDNSNTTMSLMRLSDAPIIGGQSPVLRKIYPQAQAGPVLDLAPGWEPHWTFARIEDKP
jgi:Tol biopolymer transport system component